MAQRVGPEVRSPYAQCAKPVADDGVHGRCANGSARRLQPDEDLWVKHIGPDVIDVSAQSLRHRRHEGIDLGLAALEAPDVQPPGDPVNLVEPK